MVAQSPEPGAHDKNALLFTLTLLLTIIIFAKIKSELKYEIFLRGTSPNIKNMSWKIHFIHWHPANSTPFKRKRNCAKAVEDLVTVMTKCNRLY